MTTTNPVLDRLPSDIADTPRLPLWEWLEKSLHDLQLCEQDRKHYRIDMEHWHSPYKPGGVCLVCLGGSLLAQTFHLSPHVKAGIGDGSATQLYWHLLHAINDLRRGEILEALRTARGSTLISDHCLAMLRTICDNALADAPEWETREVAEYDKDREQFFVDMEEIVALLRDLGV